VLAICAPFAIVIRGALTVTDPASPLAVDAAEATTPLPASLRFKDPVASTVTVPPPPAPSVVLAICAPPCTVSRPALTLTVPPVPDCGPVDEAKIPVSDTP
jgi:hypothetical protein